MTMTRRLKWMKGRAAYAQALALLAIASLVAAGLTGCGESGPFKIGALIPEEGAVAGYGASIRRGMDLAVEELNAPGGGGILGGRSIELLYRDSSTIEMAQVGVQELIAEHHVPAIIGAVASTVTLSVAPLVNEHEVVLLSPTSSSPVLSREGGDWFFRIYPSDIVEGQSMASFCVKNAITRVAIVAVEGPFGAEIADVFTKRYKAGSRRIVIREDFKESISKDDALAIAQRIKAKKPEVIYIAAYSADVVKILKALDEVGCKGGRLATSAVTPETIAKAGESAEGLVFPQISFDLDSEDAGVQSFIKDYRTKYGMDPDIYAAHGYDVVRVLVEAVTVAQLPTAQKIRGALLNIDYQGVTGNINFNGIGDVVKQPRLLAVLGGEVMDFADYEKAMVGKSVISR